MLCTFISFAQKKNGTVYIEHPAIDVVQEFVKAIVAGDETKMASYLTDDFKGYNGTTKRMSKEGMDKETFIKNQMIYFNQLDYFALETMPDTYPDAIEYKKDNKDDVVWVQTWDVLKGVQKNTGVKIDAAAHRLYKLNKDNKINMIIGYSNQGVILEIQASFSNRTNGKIYNHHENINTVRKGMYAFENKEIDKVLSFYSDDAIFSNIHQERGKFNTKAEIKVIWEQFLDTYTIKSIDIDGYPDYLEYEKDNGREVLSWWNYNLIRKVDKKEISLLMHLSQTFDADGKIIRHMSYFSRSLLTAK